MGTEEPFSQKLKKLTQYITACVELKVCKHLDQRKAISHNASAKTERNSQSNREKSNVTYSKLMWCIHNPRKTAHI